MSNANRDYAIVYDVKNSSLVLSRPLSFYITDKNTSNIFVKLVTKVSVGNGIDQYTDIENASNYVLTMRVIKPNNEVKSLEATQHEPENIFQFDLTEDFKNIPGKYICELTISTIVSARQELITSDPFNYEVKRSILSNVGEIIETEDTTVEKLLNDLDTTKAELSWQIKEKADKKSLFVNVKDFGALGDGVNDDTESIKLAISSIGGGYSKGGTIYIPRGRYKITDTIFIPSNINILGDGNTSYFSTVNDNIGTSLIFECNDIEKPCISFILEKIGENKIYDYVVIGNDLDNGTVRQSTSSSLKNLSIMSSNNHNIGIVFSGSPLSCIENVSIKGFLGGVTVNANWGSQINRVFINTSIFGILTCANTNNLQISNCYIDKIGDKTIDSTNKLYSLINDDDFYLKGKSTGIYCKYGFNLKVINTCIEHWEVGVQVGGAGASTNWDTIWLEKNNQPITVQSYQHAFKNIYVYGSTSKNVILSTGSNLSLENFNGQYSSLFKDTYQRNCEVVINNCRDNGELINFLNSKDKIKQVYVDEINGNDYYFGIKTKPVATLQKAFDLVENGGEIILLSDVNLTWNTRISDKNIKIKSNEDRKTISSQKDGIVIRPLEVFNSSITFENINMDCYLNADNITEQSNKAFIKPLGMFRNEVCFNNCIINTKNNYGIIQHDYENNSYLRLTLNGGKILGNGAMSKNAYNPTGTLHIEEFKQGCSIDSTVETYDLASIIINQY